LPAILAVAVVVVVVVAGAIVFSRRGSSPEATPTARPSGQPITIPSSAASSASSSAPSAASSAAASSAAAASAAASAAAKVYLVGNTDGDGVYLRRTPSMNDRDAAYPDDTELVAIGPDVTADGELWHHVRTPDGKEGYVPAKYTIEKP
jgi:hypothetical protein